ncbi:MAG TPA: acyl-CoA dehydrogenase family protein [Streptosporangiaceae bacterium]
MEMMTMGLSDAPGEAEFRLRARAWLADSLPRLPWPEPPDLEAKAPFWRQWQAMLFEDGYAGLTWPNEYGGQGLSERMRAIFTEECDRAGVPERLNIIGEDFAGPTIAHFGTDAQKQRYLRPILTGEEIWCQLFSEPDSGSDLASLRTKAVRVEGDSEGGMGRLVGCEGWRISGQKIWTSRAQLAAHAILLARTGRGRAAAGDHLFPAPDGQRRRDRAAARAHARRGGVQRGLPR